MKKLLFGVVVGLVVIAMAGSAGAFELGVRGVYWFPELRGDIQVDDSGIVGDKVDIKDDLGIDNEAYPWVEVFTGIGRHHLAFSYYEAKYDASQYLTKRIVFNGQTYNINDLVDSKINYKMYDFMYQYDIVDWENILAGFSLGIVGRVKYIDGEVGLASGTQATKQEFSAPIPLLGANFHMGLLADILEARVLLTGMGYSDGNCFDGQVDVSLTPLPFFDIHAGYRVFYLDADVDDITFDFGTAGPFVGLTISF
jgi:hypothetical protein